MDKIQAKQIKPSEILRENKKLFEAGECCAYCGCSDNLERKHIIPRSKIEINNVSH